MNSKHAKKHQRITALSALFLLEQLSEAGSQPSVFVIDSTKRALRSHVQAELTKRRTRGAKKK